MLHIENFTRRVRKVHFWHFPTKSRYRQKTCWVNSFLLLHVKNFTRRVRKVHFWHFPTKSRYRQKTCWVNSFQSPHWTAHNLNITYFPGVASTLGKLLILCVSFTWTIKTAPCLSSASRFNSENPKNSR